MKLIQREQGRSWLSAEDIREHEHPPMIRLPEYGQLREKSATASG